MCSEGSLQIAAKGDSKLPNIAWRCAGRHGWPTSKVLPGVPANEEEQGKLVDTLQEWKSSHYQELIGTLPTQPPA